MVAGGLIGNLPSLDLTFEGRRILIGYIAPGRKFEAILRLVRRENFGEGIGLLALWEIVMGWGIGLGPM